MAGFQFCQEGTMSEFVTTGEWIAKEGQADEFVGAWEVFASWAASMPGAVQQHVAEFHPAELEVVRVVGS
jgi:hypothetical protein